MSDSVKQQVLISGVGGQGILFVTRLLAEAAIYKGLPVLTSETHGMAQRGGTVVSHLKIGGYSSPLIRPSGADVLFILRVENLTNHLFYLKPGGIAVANASSQPESSDGITLLTMDADAAAKEIHQPRSSNLVLAGFALSAMHLKGLGTFCSPDDIRAVLHQKLAGRDKLLKSSLSAFNLGVMRGEKVNI
ncbi:MAG TPA: 2-oxoacid:acceptor oxidoreductase family protein [Dissulfurispiraceae bacterium]|nr:2-oxoacid:acceptor oxidoreductase family protein [Dissulfurispiraceae bacterium]